MGEEGLFEDELSKNSKSTLKKDSTTFESVERKREYCANAKAENIVLNKDARGLQGNAIIFAKGLCGISIMQMTINETDEKYDNSTACRIHGNFDLTGFHDSTIGIELGDSLATPLVGTGVIDLEGHSNYVYTSTVLPTRLYSPIIPFVYKTYYQYSVSVKNLQTRYVQFQEFT
uniref:Uncharacterized protein n=1 Tax=Rhabditophanes sp. KR3021 TaxID=114890 RepID=A0AC35TKZ9_9BILA